MSLQGHQGLQGPQGQQRFVLGVLEVPGVLYCAAASSVSGPTTTSSARGSTSKVTGHSPITSPSTLKDIGGSETISRRVALRKVQEVVVQVAAEEDLRHQDGDLRSRDVGDDHDVQQAVVELGMGGDGDAGGDEAAVGDDDVVGLHLQCLDAVDGEHGLEPLEVGERAEGGAHVGERSPAVLGFVRLLADHAAESPSPHVDEVALGGSEAGQGHVERLGPAFGQHRQRALQVGGDVDGAGEVVAGAQREQAEPGAAEAGGHAVQDLVEGAVAAGRHDQPGAGLQGLGGDPPGIPLGLGQAHDRLGEVIEPLAEGLDLAAAAGVGVDDDAGLHRRWGRAA